MFAVTWGPPATNNSSNLGTMGDESYREQVLGDGSKQSGGRRIDIPGTAAMTKACNRWPTTSPRSMPSRTRFQRA